MEPEYWNNHYAENYLPWDIGYASGPLTHYIADIDDKHARILIPGAGLAWEAEFLHRSGFTQVYVCDLAKSALQEFHQRVTDFPVEHILCADFFKLEGKYDIILEQTFLSALNPALWPAYVSKMHELLAPEGIFAGVVFASPFAEPGPPFGAEERDYNKLFSTHFNILALEISPHSILPRKGNELFFKMSPKVM